MKNIAIKVNIDKFEEKGELLEIIPKLKGNVILQFQQQEQNFVLQTQLNIEDEYSLFKLQKKQDQQNQQIETRNQIIGITDRVKFIVAHNLINNTFKQKAKIAQIKLIPDWIKDRYVAQNSAQLKESQLLVLNQINDSIKEIIIFPIHCLTKQEKITKTDFLWQNFNDIAKILASNELVIGQVEEPYQYLDQLNQFIFIVQTKVGAAVTKSEILEKYLQLNKFIQEKFIINTVIFKIENTKYSRNELKKVAQDLMSDRKNISIKVGYDQFDISNFKRMNYIEIQIYNDNDRGIQKIFEQRVQNIIELSNFEIMIFDEYVSLLPPFQQLNIEFKKMNCGLKVKGQLSQLKQMQILIKDSINQMKSQSIQIKLPYNIYQSLQTMDQTQIKQVLTKTFLLVLNNKYIISVEEVTKNAIQIKVNFHHSVNNDIVGLKSLLDDYINQLQIISLSEDQFSLLEIQPEQVALKYLAIVIYVDYKYIFILPKKYLESVHMRLESQKTMVQIQYKPISKIIAKKIELDYYTNKLQLPPDVLGLKLNSDNTIIYVQCQVKDKAIIEQIKLYEKAIEQQLIQIPLEVSEHESYYLSKHLSKELNKFQEKYNCEINFTLPQPVQQIEGIKKNNPQYFMKFKSKTVIFTANYNTEVFIKTQIKHPLVEKIAYKQEERIQPNVIIIRDFMFYQQKRLTPYKQVGFIYDDVKGILPALLNQFMLQEQTKFNELQLFINDPSLKEQCEQEAFLNIQQSLGSCYQDYQWQWLNSKDFCDYDDVLINGQIEKGYQEYLANQSKSEMQLRFPYSQHPGTHTINLKQDTILDHANGQTKIIKQKNGIYYIGNEAGDDIFQQFVQEKISKNEFSFTVFLKKYKIIFKNKNEIYQANLDTNFKRKLRRIVKQDPYYKFISDFVHRDLQSLEVQTETPFSEAHCWLKFFPEAQQHNEQLSDEMQEMKNNDLQQLKKMNIQKIQQELLDLLQPFYVHFSIILPHVNDQIFFSFMNYLNQNSVEMMGDAYPLQEIKLKTFSKAQERIIQALEFIQNIPSHWNLSQSSSFCNFYELEKEKQQILQIFPFLEIKKLESVENYNLWAKYQKVKLTTPELEQMVMFGNEEDFPLEEVHRITLNIDNLRPFAKCGTNHSYIKNKNYFISRKGERQILICQVLLGNPQELEQEYILGNTQNYTYRDYIFIKRTRMYPLYIVTLLDEN